MTSLPCPCCDRTRPGDVNVCGACAGDLARALGLIPSLEKQLEVTLSKQTSRTGNGRRSSERPLPFDLRASRVLTDLRKELFLWTRRIWRPDVQGIGWPGPLDGLADMSHTLLMNDHRVLAHPLVDQAVTQIVLMVRDAERVIDRPPERWFAGPCDQCGADLYARPDAVQVICRMCDHEPYDVLARRTWLLMAAEDQLANATLVAQALTALGTYVTKARIWKWAERGQIIPHGTSPQGHPQYRIGDVLDLVAGQRDKVS